MPDLLVSLLVIAAILLVADLLLAGGAVAMTGVGGTMGLVSHQLAAGALVVLLVALLLSPWGAG